MENKDQNPQNYAGGLDGQSYEVGNVHEAPADVNSLSAEPGGVAFDVPVQKPRSQVGRFLKFARRLDVILVILLILGVGGTYFTFKRLNHTQSNLSPTNTNSYGTIQIPLDQLVSGKQLSLQGASNVTINGQLELNDTLTLAPQVQPTGAQPGQIYYDKGSNQLAYYNGSNFVFLTGTPASGLQTLGNVQSIGGANGQITLGTGLSITGQQLNATQSGVLAFQGQTGAVTLSAGPGILINGTNFSNSGVLSIASGSPNLTVANDGKGNITLTVAPAGTGTVTSSGGAAGSIPLFTAAQNIENSIVTQSGLTVTISGDLSVVTGGLSLSNALTVSNGGTGAQSLAANGVLVGQGTAAINSVTTPTAGLCLLSTAGIPTWAACPTGSGVTSLNTLTGALNIANASAAGTTITIDNASTVTKGIASFNGTNFTTTGGAVNTTQDINSGATPTFAGVNTNTITPSAALTVGVSAQTALLQGSTTTIRSNGIGNNIVLNSAGTIELQSTTNVTGGLNTSGNLAVNGGAINSIGALSITPAGALTLGSTSQTISLQGGPTSTFSVTSGASSTVVGFTSPTANTTLNFPALAAGTYTICTTSGNCAGAGVTLQAAYNNSSSPQIVLDAAHGALTVRDNSTPLVGNLLAVQNNTGSATYLAVTSSGAVVTGTATVSGDINSTTGNLQTNSTTRIDNGGNAINLGNVTLSGAISGGTTYTGSGNINTTAGGIQTNSTTRVDNSGNLINIASVTAAGNATFQGGSATLGTATQAGNVVLSDGSSNTGTLQVTALGQNTTYILPDPGAPTATVCLTTGNCAGTGGGVTTGGGTTNQLAKFTGAQTLGNSSISDNGTNVTVAVNVIVQGGDITLGTASQPASMILNAGNGQATTLQAGASVSNLTFILPTNTGTANQCLKQSGTGNQLVWQDCDGGAGGSSATLQTAYNNSTSPEIVLNSSVGGLTIRDNSTPLGTNLFQIQNNLGSTTYLAVSVSGINVTGAATVSGNVNTTGGTLQTNSVNRVDNSGNLVNIGNITGSGPITIASVGVGNDITVNGANHFVVQNASIFNALTTFNANIDLGANSITGTTGNITLTNFGVNGTTGNVTAGTYNGQTISSAANFTGTVAVAGNTTLTGNIAVNGGNITSSGALNITPSGTLTVGVTGQQLILQGNASTRLTATSGGFTTAVGFSGVPTANVTYNFDRTPATGTYTICTSIGNCAGAGGGVTTSGGTTGTLPVFTGAQTLGNSLVAQSGSTVTVSGNLNITTGNTFQVNGTQISSANLSNDANLAKLSASETFTGNTVAFQNALNSTNAFNVQNAAGNKILTADTTNGQVVLGTASTLNGKLVFNNISNANTVTIVPGTLTGNRTLTLPDASGIICTDSGNCAGAGATLQTAYNFSTGGTTPKVKLNSTLLGFDIQDADTTIGANLFDVRASNSLGLGSVLFGVGNTGQATFQNSTNSTSALRVLTAGGTAVLTTDTTNGQILLGQGGTLNGALVFNNATNTNAITLTAPTATAAQSITLPNASGTICLNSGNCSGAGSSNTLQAAYDAGNTVTTSNSRDVSFTLADTTTDSNFLVNLQCTVGCGSNGRFAVQGSGTDVFTVSPNGGAALFRNSTNSATAFQIQTASGASTVFGVNTSTSLVTINGDLSVNGVQPASATGNGTSATNWFLTSGAGGNTTGTTGQTGGNGSTIYLTGGSGGTAPAGSANGWGGNVIIGGGAAGAGAGSAGLRGNVILQPSGGTVGVGTLSPSTAYKLDVAGDVNISSGSAYRINGTAICTGSGCIASAASAIQNGTTTQSANFNVQAATSGTIAGVLQANGAGTADILNLRNGSGTNVATFSNTGVVTLQNSTNGYQAFRILNAAGQASLTVSTMSGQATLGNITPTVGAGVAGSLTFADGTNDNFSATIGTNTLTGYRNINLPDANGTICLQSSTACGFAPTSGSANYIQNGTSTQSANFNVQAATSGSVAAVLQANGAGAGDIMDLKNGSGTAVATFSSTGAVLLKNSTDSTAAFTVQNAAGTTTLFNVDTTNGRVGVGGAASFSRFEVLGGDAAVYNNGGNPRLILGNSTAAGQNGYLQYDSTNHYFRIETVGTNGLKINDNFVSIGNIFPGQPLTVGNGSTQLFQITTTGTVVSQTTTNSTTGFQIQNAAGTDVVDVDTSNGWVGIGNNAPTSRLTVSWKSGDTTPTAVFGSSNSSNNQIALQGTSYSNIGVEGISTTSMGVYGFSNSYAGVFGQSQTSSSGIFQSNSATNTAPTLVTQQQGTATADLFQAQNSSGSSLFKITSAGNVAIQKTTPATALDVNGAIQQTGMTTAGASGTAGLWTELGTCNITIQFQGCDSVINMNILSDGNSSYFGQATVGMKVYQQNALGGSPFVVMTLNGVAELVKPADIVAVTTQNNVSGTVVQVWARMENNWGKYAYTPVMNDAYPGWTWTPNTALQASLPAGTQTATTYGDTYANTLTVQPATDTTSALQVQNAAATTTVLDVDTSNNRIGINNATPSRTLDVTTNTSVTNAPSIRLLQGGSGDSSMEFQSTSAATSFYIGQNTSDGSFSINSSTAAKGNGISYVQSLGNSTGSTPSATTLTQAITVTAGNTLAVFGSWGTGSGAMTCSDTLGNSWTTVVTKSDTTHSQSSAICYATNITGGSDTVTITVPSSAFRRIVVNEYHGLATASPVDVSSSATAANATTATDAVSSGAATTTTAGDLIFGAVEDDVASNNIAAGTGFTHRFDMDGIDTYIQDKIQYSAGSVASTNTFSNTDGYTALMVAFKAQPGVLSDTFTNSEFTLSQTGGVSFENYTNQSNAFQIQNNAGAQLFNVNTSSNTITLNGGTTSTLNAWATTTSLNTAYSFGGYAAANGYLYTIGGYGSGYQATVQFAKLNADGSVGTWNTTTALPGARGYVSAATWDGFLYAVGGTTGAANQSTIYFARLNPDGTVGTWNVTTALPATLDAEMVAISNGYMYVMGGNNGTSTVTTVYRATMHGDGGVGSFSTDTALPASLSQSGVVVDNGNIYLIGGFNGTSTVNTTYYASLNASSGAIGTWNTGTALPSAMSAYPATAMNGNIYYFAGSNTYYTPINANGSIGSWTASGYTIPNGYNGQGAASVNGYMYVLGGYNGSGQTQVVYASGPRTYVGGALDLVGLYGAQSLVGDNMQTTGSVGGTLTAGNTTVVGTLQVQSQASFNSSVAVNDGLNVSINSGLGYISQLQNTNTGTSAKGLLIQLGVANASRATTNYFAAFAGPGSTVAGKIQGGASAVAYTTSGADYAEYFLANPNNLPQPGELVALDGTNDKTVAKATSGTGQLMGVVSTNPGFIGNGPICNAYDNNCDSDYQKYNVLVAMTGQVPVKVTVANGAIHRGDPITASSTAGVGQKATKAGTIVGYAEQDASADGTIQVLIQPGYYNPPADLQGSSSNTDFTDINVAGTAQIANLTVTGSATLAQLTVSGDATISGTLTVGGTLILSSMSHAPSTAANGAMYYDTTKHATMCYQNGDWVSCSDGLRYTNTSAPAAVANTAAETAFAKNYTLPQGDCVQGRVYRVTAMGYYSTDAASTSLGFKLRLGGAVGSLNGTLLAGGSTNTMPSSASNLAWRLDAQFTCDTDPSSAAGIEAQGMLTYVTPSGQSNTIGLVNTDNVTVNTTGSLPLQLSAQWGAASAGNSITLRQLVVESLGP